MANPTSSAISQALPPLSGTPAPSPGFRGYNDASDPSRASANGVAGASTTLTLATSVSTMTGNMSRQALATTLAGQHASRCFSTPGIPFGLWLDQDAFVDGYKAVREPIFKTLAGNKTWEDNLRRVLTSRLV